MAPFRAILRRRIAALIGEWVMKIPQELRRPIYIVLLPFLHESNDIVVRLTAADTLRLCTRQSYSVCAPTVSHTTHVH